MLGSVAALRHFLPPDVPCPKQATFSPNHSLKASCSGHTSSTSPGAGKQFSLQGGSAYLFFLPSVSALQSVLHLTCLIPPNLLITIPSSSIHMLPACSVLEVCPHPLLPFLLHAQPLSWLFSFPLLSPSSVCHLCSYSVSSATVVAEVTEVAGKVDLNCLWGPNLNPGGAILRGKSSS